MTITVEYEVSFGNGDRESTSAASRGTSRTNAPDSKPQVSRVARLLALAHYVDRAVDSGLIRDYATAARRLGMTRARMAQVMKLLMLSPPIQESILTGKLGVSERILRAVLRHIDWKEQNTAAAHIA